MPRPFSAYQRAVKQKRRVRRSPQVEDRGRRSTRKQNTEVCVSRRRWTAVFCRRVGQNTRTQTPKSLPAVSDCRVSEQSGGGRECARAIEHDQRACGQSNHSKTKNTFNTRRAARKPLKRLTIANRRGFSRQAISKAEARPNNRRAPPHQNTKTQHKCAPMIQPQA